MLQDFKGLSVDKLEKYFMLLAALDENLAEYKNIKNDLEQVDELLSVPFHFICISLITF